ncbi:MAG: pyrroline-5-carboxylate reductase [Oscillospiraceae bacterium]|nr:pyrroline-5-carboxylate reductase [Oscillospiraceae bacterium]
MFERIGFIGTGAMGGAVAKLVYEAAPTAELYLANRTAEKAAALASRLPGAVVSTNAEAAGKCELIFLAVKPQMMPGVLAGIAPVLAGRRDRFVLVTMAAGLTMDTIRTMAGGDYPVIRMMPNTPITVGAGAVQYCGLGVTGDELAAFAALLSGAGTVDPLPEHLIDAASAVSGCGPAFVDLFLEALADGGVACGLPRPKAMAYAAAMVEGAAKMARLSGDHPGALKDAVCSPAGSTIQGVRALEKGAFRGAVMDAVIAAYEKNRELGRRQ